jgi:hypothetical protein
MAAGASICDGVYRIQRRGTGYEYILVTTCLVFVSGTIKVTGSLSVRMCCCSSSLELIPLHQRFVDDKEARVEASTQLPVSGTKQNA